MVIEKHRILGTPITVYTAWEPWAGHHVTCHHNGKAMGMVGTRPLPPTIAAMPSRTPERAVAVREWYEAQYHEAYQAIHRAYPGLVAFSQGCGEVSVTD